MVALVRCAARPAVVHIPGLPDPSGDIVMYAGVRQVNVAAVDSAMVSGDDHFTGLPGLPSTRGYGTIFPVLGLPLDGPDLWNLRGPSMISETHGLAGTFNDIRNLAGPAGLRWRLRAGSAGAPARVRTVGFPSL